MKIHSIRIKMLILLALLGLCECTLGYKILCVFPVPSRSHGHLAKGIVDPLLKAGHQITWVTPFSDWKPHKNLTLIGVPETVDLLNQLGTQNDMSISEVVIFARNISNLVVANQKFRKTLTEEQFDAVVTEWFASDNDAGYAAVQQVPWIMLCGTLFHHHMEFLVDEVRSIATVPSLHLHNSVPMDFWSRVKNTLFYGFLQVMRIISLSSARQKYEKDFTPLAEGRGVPLPSYDEAIHNVSILLVNSHPSVAPATVLPPNVVEIGGYHIEEDNAPLPQDLQTLLDNSPQGVVYFSMGSVFRAKDMPKSSVRALASMLGELKHTVLWKFEEPLEDLPKNVHTRLWFPQTSVLAHPNTVLFITHGGLLSFNEAVRHGVPLMALPVFGDQHANAARAVRLGFGRTIPWHVGVAPALRKEIRVMLEQRSYYERAQELSRLFNARPVAPRALITHYIELAIQTKGAYHLRSVSRLYPWWARWMIDQLLAVALLAGIVVYAARRLLALILLRLILADFIYTEDIKVKNKKKSKRS